MQIACRCVDQPGAEAAGDRLLDRRPAFLPPAQRQVLVAHRTAERPANPHPAARHGQGAMLDR
ncbi:hypothetical protein, partial [Geminicoccus harenae]